MAERDADRISREGNSCMRIMVGGARCEDDPARDGSVAFTSGVFVRTGSTMINYAAVQILRIQWCDIYIRKA